MAKGISFVGGCIGLVLGHQRVHTRYNLDTNFHPGFQGFVKENHIKNAAFLKGSLLVYANKLGWGRESALLEDASDWLEDIGFNEEDVIASSDDATSSDGDFTQSDSDSESDVDSDVDSVDDAEHDKCSSDDEDDAS